MRASFEPVKKPHEDMWTCCVCHVASEGVVCPNSEWSQFISLITWHNLGHNSAAFSFSSECMISMFVTYWCDAIWGGVSNKWTLDSCQLINKEKVNKRTNIDVLEFRRHGFCKSQIFWNVVSIKVDDAIFAKLYTYWFHMMWFCILVCNRINVPFVF